MKPLHSLLCLIALIGVGAGPAAAQTAQPTRLTPEARERFTAALAAYRDGSWSEAAQGFSDPALAAPPLRQYALLYRAECVLQLGDSTAARALAGQAADRGADGGLVPSAQVQAATVLANAGDDAGAVTALRRFLAEHADHPEAARARYTLGHALLALGQGKESARAFTELWLTAPASVWAEGAAQQLKGLSQSGVTVPVPTPAERLERAERLLTAGLVDPARGEADALLAEPLPTESLLRALRVVQEASRRLGKDDAALAAANRGLAVAPAERRAPWLLDIAKLLQRKSREQALLTVDRLVREYPKSGEAAEGLMLKARLFEATARLAAAETVYVKLAADYPDEEEGGAALWRLGWLAWFRGAYDEAAVQWQRLLTIRGGVAYREAALYWVGRTWQARGLREPAASRFSQLVSESPRTYYGVLAARRLAAPGAVRATAPELVLPADPLQALQGEARYARAEALRMVGLRDFADEEMDALARRAVGDPTRLYAVSAAYAQDARYHLALRILRRYFQAAARSGAVLPRAFWEMFYPFGWRVELTDAAGRAALDPHFVAAVVREESSFYPQARSRVGARGLMQLMPETARPMAQARRLSFADGAVLDDPAVNLDLGSTFLGLLLRDFGDPRLAAAAYNAGPTRVREWWAQRRSDDLEVWIEQIPFNETRAFVKRVMLSWDEYRRLYGGAR
jgi:soluble lytic murein transglycosylase